MHTHATRIYTHANASRTCALRTHFQRTSNKPNVRALLFITCNHASRKRSHKDAELSVVAAERRRTNLGVMLTTNLTTKTALVTMLRRLHGAGLLDGPLTTRKQVSRAVAEHGQADTPYGKVMQKMALPNGEYLDIIHPAAFLAHMCRISAEFAELVYSIMQDKLGYIIYADGLVPGNVFRHDKGRKIQAIY